MSTQPPTLEYHRPAPRPDRWQLGRLIDWLTSLCLFAALYFIFLSFLISKGSKAMTPAYQQFQQHVLAQAATRPAGSPLQWPQFHGPRYVPVPLFRLGTTYIAIGFAAAGTALIVFSLRQSSGSR